MRVALAAGEAIVRSDCPSCGKAASVWVTCDEIDHQYAVPGDPHPVRLSGLITDLIHDDPQAANVCPLLKARTARDA